MGREWSGPANERLRARMAEIGWGQAELAKALRVSVSQVSRWLGGKRVPSLDMAFRMERSPLRLSAEIWLTPSETSIPVAADSSESLPADAIANVPAKSTA